MNDNAWKRHGLRLALVFTISTLVACGGSGGSNIPPGSPDDITPPEVTSTTPEDGATEVPINQVIDVIFSEPVLSTALGGAIFDLEYGSEDSAASVTGTASINVDDGTASFTPDATLPTDTTFTMTITGITDTNDNPLEPYSWSFSTSGDTVAPEITNSSPEDGSIGVLVDQIVTATFNEDILYSSIDDTSFTLLGLTQPSATEITGITAYNDDTRTAVFTPEADLDPQTNYTARLSTDVADIEGNALPAEYSWTFRTHGNSWGEAAPIELFSETSGEPQLATDNNGNVIAIWSLYSQFFGSTSIASMRYTADNGWSGYETVGGNSLEDAIDPQIAVNENGDAVAVWLQGDNGDENVWSNLYTAGTGEDAGWGEPQPLEDNTNDASSPHVEIDANGNAIAVWVQESDDPEDGTSERVFTSRYTPGTEAAAGWGEPDIIDDVSDEVGNTGDAFTLAIAMDPEGNALVVWEKEVSISTRTIFANRFDITTGNWDATATPLSQDDAGDAENPTVAMDENGNAIAIWWEVNNDGTAENISRSHYTPASGWEPALILAEDVNPNSPQIAINASGTALAVWSQGNDVWSNRYIPGTGDAADWGDAEPLTDDVNIDEINDGLNVVIDASGNGLAIWSQNDSSGDNIYSSRFIPGLGWGDPEPVEDAGPAANNPAIAIDSNGVVTAVWEKEDDEVLSIQGNRFE